MVNRSFPYYPVVVLGATLLLIGQMEFPARGQSSPATAARNKALLDRLRCPRDPNRPLADKLRSPRETLKTLYFAVNTYDLFPAMMDEAILCLDLEAMPQRPKPEDAAMMALTLEDILQTLALPLSGISDQETGDKVVLASNGTFQIVLRRCGDGGWRFSAETLAQLTALRQLCRDLHKPRPAEATAFREGFTDPRTVYRKFLIDVAHRDFYAAARALDLNSLSDQQRREQGPILAHQLALVLQRRGFFFRQEMPFLPDGPAFTLHANQHGRITLHRVRQADGKEAWLFGRQTVRQIPAMYQAVKDLPPDNRHVLLGTVVPDLDAKVGAVVPKGPEDVPAHLGSPRALLQGFFRAMEVADANDARLVDALEYLDLENVPVNDRSSLGCKLATKLEMVLRKLPLDLSAVSNDWSAQTQILGEAQGVRIEIHRERDGCWRFSEATVNRIPEMYDRLAGKVRADQDRGTHLDNPRDTMITFQTAAGHHHFTQAARCLDLSAIHASAREELGLVLAFKLKFVLDRIGHVFIQEIPDNPEGPRFLLYRGELGRIVLDRKAEDPGKGQWLFTTETIGRIESMFLAVQDKPLDATQQDAANVIKRPRFWETPGIWVRLHLPAWLQVRTGRLDLYQWLGLVLAALLSWVSARLVMVGVTQLIARILHRSGSALSTRFVASSLKPFTWLGAVWLFFLLLGALDLTVAVAGTVFAIHKFLLAGLFGWLGLRFIDLFLGIYTNSELLRPHRNLGDMIVPVAMRLSKATVLLVVATFMIYQVGELELLGRFLTGLGVAGLAASLAAQDAMKSFFGTLLLIGERAFKIGDWIIVGDKEGMVEQVGFRSTRLRTADDSLLTIPNSVIAAVAIDNMGARILRRLTSNFVIGPDTGLDQVAEFRARLQTWLTRQPLVVQEKVDLHVHQFTSSGVELRLVLFLTAKTSKEETQFRHSLHCEILQIVKDLEVTLAPAQKTILLQEAGELPSGREVHSSGKAA